MPVVAACPSPEAPAAALKRKREPAGQAPQVDTPQLDAAAVKPKQPQNANSFVNAAGEEEWRRNLR